MSGCCCLHNQGGHQLHVPSTRLAHSHDRSMATLEGNKPSEYRTCAPVPRSAWSTSHPHRKPRSRESIDPSMPRYQARRCPLRPSSRSGWTRSCHTRADFPLQCRSSSARLRERRPANWRPVRSEDRPPAFRWYPGFPNTRLFWTPPTLEYRSYGIPRRRPCANRRSDPTLVLGSRPESVTHDPPGRRHHRQSSKEHPVLRLRRYAAPRR